MKDWAISNLKKLGFPHAQDVLPFILSADDEETVKDYMHSMLDLKKPSHQKFMDEFLRKLQQNKCKTPTTMKITREKAESANSKPSPTLSSAEKKKKQKYVSIYSENPASNDTILIPGRHKCDCQALKHSLINNCLKCGKIVCEQEGSGPCSFCGNLVVSKEEQEVLNRGSKKSEALQNRLLNTKKLDKTDEPSLQKAIAHKNKLLEYDKTSEKRTRVFDDQSDYFHTGSTWINPEAKAKLKKMEDSIQEQKYSRSTTVGIDLLGRKVVQVEDGEIDFDSLQIQGILEEERPIFRTDMTDPGDLVPLSRPVYVESANSSLPSRHVATDTRRVQDRLMQEMSDDGMCMSMHQPWASLLVMGIKKHEGRVWYSSHRGRLWIASGAKVPSEDEIQQVEDMYREMYKSRTPKFPRQYPSGCLIGCVDVVDVLPQEEYRSSFPDGESGSPYVFVCENPKEMVVKFPMKGQHKIYKLDSKIHKAAKQSIRDI